MSNNEPVGVELTEGEIRAAYLAEYSHAKVRDRYDADLLMSGFADGARWFAARQVPTHICDSGHFDRTACPEPCGTMHSYCATCGARADRCAHDARQAPTVLDRETVAKAIDQHGYTRTEVGHECPCGHVYCEQGPGAYMEPDRDWLHGAIKDHQADAVLALPGVTQARTVALGMETVAAELFALGPYCGDMCGEWVTACAWCKGHYGSMAGDLVAVDPRRTEAEVKAEALREAADLCHHADQARCTWVDCPCRAINALAARIAGAPDA